MSEEEINALLRGEDNEEHVSVHYDEDILIENIIELHRLLRDMLVKYNSRRFPRLHPLESRKILNLSKAIECLYNCYTAPK